MLRLNSVLRVSYQKQEEKALRQEGEAEGRMMSWLPPDWTSGWARSSVWIRLVIVIIR